MNKIVKKINVLKPKYNFVTFIWAKERAGIKSKKAYKINMLTLQDTVEFIKFQNSRGEGDIFGKEHTAKK